jgi:hypothetical protein
MSTKTNFKRIALIAVASLGLGILSSVPSQAAVNADTLTIKNTNGVTTSEFAVANGDTITAQTSARAVLSFLPGTAIADSLTITASLVTSPTGNTALPYMSVAETTSANLLVRDSVTVYAKGNGGDPAPMSNAGIDATVVQPNARATCRGLVNATVSTCTLNVYLGKGSATAGATVAGTYTVKLTIGNLDGTTPNAAAATLTFVVASASVGTTSGTAYISSANPATLSTDDLTAPIVTKALSTTPKAWIKVTQSTPTTANESVTATIAGPGTLGSGASNTAAATGRSILVKNGDTITVWADGTAGDATITLTGATSGYKWNTKTVTFTGTAIAKLVIAAENPVISATGGSATDAISVQAFDSDGKQISAPTIYVLSSDQTKISDNYVACTAGWYAPYKASYCSLTAVAAGTSKITVSTHAAASIYQGDGVTTTKVTSNEVSVRVGSVTAASFSLSLDKATYAPGEKATLTVTPLDASGLAVAGTYLDGNATYAGFFTTGGITSDYATYTGSDTSTATFLAPSTVTGVKKFTVYMPLQSSTITFKASAGAHFSAVYQNKTGAVTGTPVSVSAKVTANTEAAAALAAVTALAVTVASLKTLITTLTNLVLKIQKKVKA